MKGIVFTELCEMVEETFGIETLNEIIERSDLPSGGVYSAIGTYDFQELLELVTHLSKISNISIPDLVHAYGHYFFNVLFQRYGSFFEDRNLFSFLKSIDQHIHVEVKKLYPDAELPSFDYHEHDNKLEMIYTSERGLHRFAQALIEKTIEHFNEKASLECELLNEQGTKAKFIISKLPD